MYSRRLSMLECLFEKLACKLMEMKLSWAIDYSIAGCKNVYRSEAPSNHLNVFDKMLKPQNFIADSNSNRRSETRSQRFSKRHYYK